jgi:hypothetical protein
MIHWQRRRERWLAATACGLLVVLGLLLWPARDVEVIVYNDGPAPLTEVIVRVGVKEKSLPVMEPHESRNLAFSRHETARDFTLFARQEKEVKWTAPMLVTDDLASLTLRVDEFGNVSFSTQRRWSILWREWLQ